MLICIDNIFGLYVNLYCILVLLYYIISLNVFGDMDLLNYMCGVFDDCWIMGVIKLMNMLSNLFGY